MIDSGTASEGLLPDSPHPATLTSLGASLVAAPFLFPFSAGPSANVWQLFCSWGCLAALLLWARPRLPRNFLLLWLGFGVVSVALFRGSGLGTWLPACVALGAIALASCIGAGFARGANNARFAALGWGLLAAGLINAILGLLQYYGHTAPLVPWTTSPDLGVAYGNLRQRNQFATLISMALIAALWLHAVSGPRVRAALLPAGVLLILAAAASTSRTGLLQLLLISGIATWIAWRERRRPGVTQDQRLPSPLLLAALIPAYFAAGWLLPQLTGADVESMLHRLREGAPDAHSRLVLWRNVLELIGQHPWAGWGWGELSFAHYSTLYEGPRFTEILDNAHNLPLHLAVELGIPAALLVCGGFCWLVLAARPWRETDPARLMAWGLLGAIVLHSLLEYPLWYGPFQLVFGLCLGFLWPAPPRAPQAKRFPAAPSLAAALAVMVVVGYAAWDYTRISQLYLARDERLPAWRDDTLAKVQDSWLFENQVKFAELTLTTLSTANAAEVHALAQRVLHFSPEPRVIVKLIDSAMLLGRTDEALAQAVRFRNAFPREYARWLDNEPVDDPAE